MMATSVQMTWKTTSTFH